MSPLKRAIKNSVDNSNNFINYNNNNNNFQSDDSWKNLFHKHRNSPDSYFLRKRNNNNNKKSDYLRDINDSKCKNENKTLQSQLSNNLLTQNMKLESERFRNETRKTTTSKLAFETNEIDSCFKPSNTHLNNSLLIQRNDINTNISQNIHNNMRIIQLKEEIKHKQELINDKILSIKNCIDPEKGISQAYPDLSIKSGIHQIKEAIRKFH